MKDDLEDKITRECTALAESYMTERKEKDAAEALKNIEIVKSETESKENLFHRLIRTKELWEEMMDFTSPGDIRKRLAPLL